MIDEVSVTRALIILVTPAGNTIAADLNVGDGVEGDKNLLL